MCQSQCEVEICIICVKPYAPSVQNAFPCDSTQLICAECLWEEYEPEDSDDLDDFECEVPRCQIHGEDADCNCVRNRFCYDPDEEFPL